MIESRLKEALDEAVEKYNCLEFIEKDPIQIPHSFSSKEDIEVSAFLIALISWGKRELILKSGYDLMNRMDHAPYEFILTASEIDLKNLSSFVHRTLNGQDALLLVKGLRKIYLKGGLEKAFEIKSQEENAFQAISRFRSLFLDGLDYPARFGKHLADPEKGSAAKRLNMFLRWMVRSDSKGVDFGIWKSLKPSALLIPLDVHSGRVARQFNLLSRKQNDNKAVTELGAKLSLFDPSDPVKYDYALFGLGVNSNNSK
jgi:uncharacterized protein (TIGR02757 family)